MTKEQILRQEWKKAGFEMDETNEAWKITLQAMQIYNDKQLLIHSVSESTLTVPDIRNKLSPITHLISMVEREETDFIKKAIPQAKKSVNYLAQRDVYSR